MDKQQGFSLIEVLVSLMLVSMTALALLEQQWHSTQLFNQLRVQTKALSVLDNASEQWFSHIKPSASFFRPFLVSIENHQEAIRLELQWLQQEPLAGLKKRSISRMLVEVI